MEQPGPPRVAEFATPKDELAALASTVATLKPKLEARRAVLEATDRSCWPIEMLCNDDDEHKQLRSEIEKAQKRQQLLLFKQDNKTSFADSDGSKAVLGVTSGLKLPTMMLPTESTEDKIATLIRRHYTGGIIDRLIEQEMQKRREPLLKKAGIEPEWWERLPREQEDELRRVVEAEIDLPRVGLVDDGGQSKHPVDQRMLSDGHRHGFIAAVTAAFANHYPLKLKPQHFWLMVAQGVATHVDLNAETVRSSWVEHEGKKTLDVCCDEFQLDQANDWASVVSGKPDSFAAQIAANTVDGVMEVLAPPFSNTSVTEDIAQKIVVMDICKNFFEYRCSTMCGFPQITLEGSITDWTVLREATERLLGRCEKSFASEWAKSLLPLLDKLLAARQGEVDSLFWNSMCKRGGTFGSGARTWFNGWFNVFFPYIDRRPNSFCEPYRADRSYVVPVSNEMDEHTGELSPGPDCEDFGSGMSQAPVAWNYYGQEFPLEFNAGFTGAVQDPGTLEIAPQIGWFITHKIPEGA